MNLRNYQINAYKDGKFKDLSPEVLAYLDGEFKKIPSDKPKEDKPLKPVKEETDLFKDA